MDTTKKYIINLKKEIEISRGKQKWTPQKKYQVYNYTRKSQERNRNGHYKKGHNKSQEGNRNLKKEIEMDATKKSPSI